MSRTWFVQSWWSFDNYDKEQEDLVEQKRTSLGMDQCIYFVNDSVSDNCSGKDSCMFWKALICEQVS